MGEEKSRDITGITVRYSDGGTKEIQSGCCVDLEKGSDDLSVEMLNVKPFDLVRLAYGLVAAVQRLDNINDPLEPLKISSALKSELLKLQFRKAEKPESISLLDYTVIAALKEALEKRVQSNDR